MSTISLSSELPDSTSFMNPEDEVRSPSKLPFNLFEECVFLKPQFPSSSPLHPVRQPLRTITHPYNSPSTKRVRGLSEMALKKARSEEVEDCPVPDFSFFDEAMEKRGALGEQNQVHKQPPPAPRKRGKLRSTAKVDPFYLKIPREAQKIGKGDFFDVFRLGELVYKVPRAQTEKRFFVSDKCRFGSLQNVYNQYLRLKENGLPVIEIFNNPPKDGYILEPYLSRELRAEDLRSPRILEQLAHFISYALQEHKCSNGTYFEILDLKLDNFRFTDEDEIALCDFWEIESVKYNNPIYKNDSEVQVSNFLNKNIVPLFKKPDEKEKVINILLSRVEDEETKHRLLSLALEKSAVS